jgi:hypothetical protein
MAPSIIKIQTLETKRKRMMWLASVASARL